MTHDGSPLTVPSLEPTAFAAWVRDLDARLAALWAVVDRSPGPLAVEPSPLSIVRQELAASGEGLIVPAATGPLHAAQLQQLVRLGTVHQPPMTVTGFTAAFTTALWSMLHIPPFVFIWIPALTGTSNATTFLVSTIPVSLRPLTGYAATLTSTQDNGASFQTGLVQIAASDGIVDLRADANGASFTASGTKGCRATLIAYSQLKT